jgi:hypothetical protein
MAEYFEKVLTDGWQGVYEENYRLSSESFGGMDGPSWSITKYTLKGGKQHGVDLVEVDNGHMTVVVVPTRGMNVLEAFTDEATLGWDSPVRQVVHPAYVNEESRGRLGWLEGFNELVCRCGLSYNGAPGEDVIRTNTGAEARVVLPLHGTISNTPALRVAVRVQLGPPYRLSVIGDVDDTQMFGSAYRLQAAISTIPGSSEFTIKDVVENLSAGPAELELLYHCNYGPPLLGEGSRLVAPVKFVCPRDARAQEGIGAWDVFAGPAVGFAEQCYFCRLHADGAGRTTVALVSADEKLAATIRFPAEQLPAFTLWKNTAAEADGYVTGLEPGTDYPNSRFFERQQERVVQLPGGGKYTAELTLGLVKGAGSVARLKEEVAAMARGKEKTVAEEPVPEYCPS